MNARTQPCPSRVALALGVLSACSAGSGEPSFARNTQIDLSAMTMEVHAEDGCSCCSGWMAYFEAAGMEIVEHRAADLTQFKLDHGIPDHAQSCHTGLVEGYVIEGHVPGEALVRLLEGRPDAVGISVPGMPRLAPGMGGTESDWRKLPVKLIHASGELTDFPY